MHANKQQLKCNLLRPYNLSILPRNSSDIVAEVFRECISNSTCVCWWTSFTAYQRL